MGISEAITDAQRARYETLEAAPGNAVVYSEKAWAVARKAQHGGPNAAWFPDRGAHCDLGGISLGSLMGWADDWVIMVPANG